MDAIEAIRRQKTLPKNAVVWFEIPVTDLEKAKTFYGEVLQTEFTDQTTGPNPIAVFGHQADKDGISGHLYPGTPAKNAGPTVHLAAIDGLEDAVARVAPAGGKVVSPIIDIPAGRFCYCEDPDGNSFGLFAA